MRRSASISLVILLVAAAFAAGYGVSRLAGGGQAAPSGRKVLYYVDPMNPAFRSEEPGTAPCGMPLEPVYEETAGSGEAAAASMPPGTVQVRPDRQQTIGLRAEEARVGPVSDTLRLFGRVAPDEQRLYRMYSVTEGWIRWLSPATTGSLVRRDEHLASYYSQETLGPQQAYIYALDALDRFVESGTATPDQIELNKKNVRTTRQILLNLGMCETQVDQVAKDRQVAQNVEIRSPVGGFILARNVSQGQRFDRTTEMYTIADLGRVWVLAAAFEHEAAFLRPGTKATIRLAGSNQAFEGRVSDVLPRFDPETRTLRARLEVANPGFVLRPDMFVDVELPVALAPALAVPSSAVLDSGLAKTVFVDRGEGIFEPRRVETGSRLGGLVEITGGLMPGERVVVSGNFLLDSESRMRLAAAGPTAATSRDPVCGMDVDEAKARAGGLTSDHGGKTYFFCAPGCKESFDANPASFLR